MRGFHRNIRGESSRRDLDRIGQSEFSQKWKFRRRQAKICGGKKLRIGKKCELFRFSTELSNRYGPETASDQKKRKDSLLKRQAKSPIPKESNEARNGHGPVWVITNCALDQREKTIFSPNLAAATGPLASGSDCECFGRGYGLCVPYWVMCQTVWVQSPTLLAIVPTHSKKRWKKMKNLLRRRPITRFTIRRCRKSRNASERCWSSNFEDARRRSKTLESSLANGLKQANDQANHRASGGANGC